jgi:hypothetical protein
MELLPLYGKLPPYGKSFTDKYYKTCEITLLLGFTIELGIYG